MPRSQAQVLGTGTVVSIGGLTGVASGNETFTVIGEVKSIKASGFKRGQTMVTNFDSQGIAQKRGTILDLGSYTITTNRVGKDAGQLAVIAACLANGEYDFKVQLPKDPQVGQTTSGDLISITGIITEAGSFDIDLDTDSDYTFVVDINSYSVTAGS